jgi:hypothetical protein
MSLRVPAGCVAGLRGGRSGSPCRDWRAGGVCAGRARRLWRPGGGGERGEGLAPAAAGFRGQAFGGAAFVFFLPGVPGVQDALVADDEQGRREQHEGAGPMRLHQPRLMSLVAGSLVVAKPRSAPVRRA